MILQQHKFKRYSFTTLTLEPTENSVNLFLRRLVFCWVQGTVRKNIESPNTGPNAKSLLVLPSCGKGHKVVVGRGERGHTPSPVVMFPTPLPKISRAPPSIQSPGLKPNLARPQRSWESDLQLIESVMK